MKNSQKNARLYSIWQNMKQRCHNPNNPKYSSYGAKGIKVCDEWRNSFSAFSTWARNNGYVDPPEGCTRWYMSYDALTIDRIEKGRGYEPSNCRWIPFQANRLHR